MDVLQAQQFAANAALIAQPIAPPPVPPRPAGRQAATGRSSAGKPPGCAKTTKAQALTRGVCHGALGAQVLSRLLRPKRRCSRRTERQTHSATTGIAIAALVSGLNGQPQGWAALPK